MVIDRSIFKPRRILTYLFNGGIATSIQFSVLFIAVNVFKADPLPMSALAFIVSLCVGFTIHRFGTFARRDIDKIGKHFILVASMAITNLCINTIAMYILLGLNFHYLVAQFFVTGTIVTWTYVGYNYIFKSVGSTATPELNK